MVIHDFPGGGISTNQADYLLVEDNLVYGNANWSFYGNSGISVWQAKAAATTESVPHRIVVRRNASQNNRQFVPSTACCGPTITDGNGIIVDQNKATSYPHRTLVENNVVFGNGGSGIHVFASRRVDVVNNTAYQNSATPELDDGEIYSNGGEDVRIYNNVAYARPGDRANSNWNNRNVAYAGNVWFGGPVAAKGPTDVVADPRLAAPAAYRRGVAWPCRK
jgi:parallel beta-helix repeat protein